MNSEKKERVTFYSKNDSAYIFNLPLVETLLQNFNPNNEYDLNDIIELYQAKLYIDNDFFIAKWTDEQILYYKNTTKSTWQTVTSFLLKINDFTFISLFDSVEIGYQPAFWELIEKLSIYKNISVDIFRKVLIKPDLWIKEVLGQKNLTSFYGVAIKDYLLGNDEAAELLLYQFEQLHDSDNFILYFPNCLNSEDKEQIILNYLNKSNPNVNYVRLIEKSRDDKIKLKPQTRLKAKKVSEQLNKKILTEGYTWESGISISIIENQVEPILSHTENNIQHFSYSLEFLNAQKDDITLVNNFSLLFDYIDIFGCIDLIPKDIEIDPMEKILVRSRNEYLTGINFTKKSKLSHLQLVAYISYLEHRGKRIENILSSFINDYLIESYGLFNLKFNFPSQNTSYLEKNRIIAPELESLLKQYKLFVEEGSIDNELFQISSQPISFKEIPSLVAKKYVYGTGNEFNWLKYYLFSESMLAYIDPFKGKYQNLYGLIKFEEVRLDNFKSYHKHIITKLIDDGYLHINSHGFIKIKEEEQIFIIGLLNTNEVTSYWHFPENIRNVIDAMHLKGLIYFGNTLFSEAEWKYFNFYLNKSEFTNGLDLRNKYAHGTNTNSEEGQKNEYFVLIKLLILIVLKLEYDLMLAHSHA